MLRGGIAAIAAMALWGLVFAMPLFVRFCAPIEIAFGRFAVFGIIAMLSLLGQPNRLPHRRHWSMACLCAATNSTLYYILVIAAMQKIGANMVTALFCSVPLIVSLYGNYHEKQIAWPLFAPSTLLMATGIALTQIPRLHGLPSAWSDTITGLLFAVAAVASWSWYAVENKNYLEKNTDIDGQGWASLLGIFSMLLCIPFIIVQAIAQPHTLFLASNPALSLLGTYCIVSLILGILSSWLTLTLWNYASTHLPLTLLGQLIVFEALFGLGYIYYLEHTLPSFTEIIGLTAILVSVVTTTLLLSKE